MQSGLDTNNLELVHWKRVSRIVPHKSIEELNPPLGSADRPIVQTCHVGEYKKTMENQKLSIGTMNNYKLQLEVVAVGLLVDAKTIRLHTGKNKPT